MLINANKVQQKQQTVIHCPDCTDIQHVSIFGFYLIAGCCYTSVHDSSRTFALFVPFTHRGDGSALIG